MALKFPKRERVRLRRNSIYRSVLDAKREIPAWIDEVLHKAVHPDSEQALRRAFRVRTHELRHPPAAYLNRTRPALLERNPVVFWKTVSLVVVDRW